MLAEALERLPRRGATREQDGQQSGDDDQWRNSARNCLVRPVCL
jgi:hypothetical protein